MDIKTTPDTCELSPEASNSRREYYRKWRADNKNGDKAIKLRYWEKKAQEYYGEDYIGPESSDQLSRQAKEVRRKYYADYRNKNREALNKTYKNYWENKAKEIIK